MGYRPGPGWTYEKTNQASRVIPAYAKIENPYRGEKPDWVMKQDNYKKAQSDWFDQLRSQGYDAWVPDSGNGSLAVVLKNQGTNVKSAIGNQGTFDITKKHMGKSEGGRTGYQTKGRVIGDAVDAAMRLVMGGSDEAAKSGIKTYHGTPQPTENLIDLFHGTTPEAFDAITSSGNIFGSSRFSPRRDVAETFAYNVGGDDNTVVKVKAPASSLMIDLDLPNAKLLTPDQAATYLDKPDWTILDFIENGYSVGVPDTSVLSIDRAAGGRTGFYGNNSISGALNVARGMNGGK
jgi:hypothetical protein